MKPTVIVTINGGVATVEQAPVGVVVIDHDEEVAYLANGDTETPLDYDRVSEEGFDEDNPQEPEPDEDVQEPTEPPTSQICGKCGADAKPDDSECGECGGHIVDVGDMS